MRREVLEEGQHDRHGDVVGQVGDERRGFGPGQLGHRQRVGRDEAQPVDVLRLEVAHRLLERAREPRVDLDGGDVAHDGQQRQRQRAEAGADLDDDVVRARRRRRARSCAPCWGRRRSSAPTAWSGAPRGARRARASAAGPSSAASASAVAGPRCHGAHPMASSCRTIRWADATAVRRRASRNSATRGPRPRWRTRERAMDGTRPSTVLVEGLAERQSGDGSARSPTRRCPLSA